MIKKIYLDGNNNGIVCELPKQGKKRTFVLTTDKQVRKFPNVYIAKLCCDVVRNNPDTKFWIKLQDGRMISTSSCLVDNDGVYHFVDNEEKCTYLIYPNKESKLLQCGYITFEGGENGKVIEDANLGIQRNEMYFNIIKSCSSNLIAENYDEGPFKICRSNKDEFVIQLKGSTVKVHIVTNRFLMNLNQARKEKNQRVLPFLKNVDRYLSLYFYFEKESYEPQRLEAERLAGNFINRLKSDIDRICEKEDTIKLLDTPFKGYVEI